MKKLSIILALICLLGFAGLAHSEEVTLQWDLYPNQNTIIGGRLYCSCTPGVELKASNIVTEFAPGETEVTVDFSSNKWYCVLTAMNDYGLETPGAEIEIDLGPQIGYPEPFTGLHVKEETPPEPPPSIPDDVIIDNDGAGTSYTGTWAVSGGSTPYGSDSLWARNGATYTWTFSPEQTGDYEVFMWWSSWSSRTTNASVTVTATDGSHDMTINQQQNAGQWNSLGIFSFEVGYDYSVTITAANGSSVSTCADAVKWVWYENGGNGGNSGTGEIYLSETFDDWSYNFAMQSGDCGGYPGCKNYVDDYCFPAGCIPEASEWKSGNMGGSKGYCWVNPAQGECYGGTGKCYWHTLPGVAASGDGFIHGYFGERDEMYIRYYSKWKDVQWASSWGPDIGHKLFWLYATNYGQFLYLDFLKRSDQSKDSYALYTYANGYQVYTEAFGYYSVIPTDWNCYEHYFKMNTPGQNNGVYRLWVNGALKIEDTSVTYRNNADQHFYMIEIGGNAKTPTGPTSPAYDSGAMKEYIDNLVVSDSYVGP